LAEGLLSLRQVKSSFWQPVFASRPELPRLPAGAAGLLALIGRLPFSFVAALVRPAGDRLEFPKSDTVLVVGKDASAPPGCIGDTEPLSRSRVAVLRAVTAATPIPIPNSKDKNPSRTSRRNARWALDSRIQDESRVLNAFHLSRRSLNAISPKPFLSGLEVVEGTIGSLCPYTPALTAV
jgi:hypothetical protein